MSEKVFQNGSSTLTDHVKAAETTGDYAETFLRLVKANVSVSAQNVACALAVLWSVGERRVVKYALLEAPKTVATLPIVVKMLRILDAPRKKRQLERKVAVVKKKKTRKALEQRMTEVNKDYAEWREDKKELKAATGALAKVLNKQWLRRFTADELEYYMIAMPSLELWRTFADVTHASPKDFVVPYFLHVVHGGSAPVESLVAAVKGTAVHNAADVEALLTKHPRLGTCFSYLRHAVPPQQLQQCAVALSATMPLMDAVWFFHELCPGPAMRETNAYEREQEVGAVLKRRLASDEPFTGAAKGADADPRRSSYGILMSRLLYLRRRQAAFVDELAVRAAVELEASAPPELADIKSRCRAAVFGDKSSSMQVAVDAAAICASALGQTLNAELSFFDSKATSRETPKTVAETIACADQVRASGTTAPAACLWPFYKKKKALDVIVVVTDEEENSDQFGNWLSQGYRTSTKETNSFFFAALFERYIAEVAPQATLFFVTFRDAALGDGPMVTDLRARGLGEKVHSFTFDPRNPDLSKFTTLLGLIAVVMAASPSSSSVEEDHDDDTASEVPTVSDYILVSDD